MSSRSFSASLVVMKIKGWSTSVSIRRSPRIVFYITGRLPAIVTESARSSPGSIHARNRGSGNTLPVAQDRPVSPSADDAAFADKRILEHRADDLGVIIHDRVLEGCAADGTIPADRDVGADRAALHARAGVDVHRRDEMCGGRDLQGGG